MGNNQGELALYYLKWLYHLHCGVAKDGGIPVRSEWDYVLEKVKLLLEPLDKK